MEVKVSIIIPVYNVESYILECLKSIEGQSLTKGIECIVVDDCGKDRSIEIVEDFVNNYHGSVRFRIIRHTINGGLSAARNSAIKAANGKYLLFLDGDDYLMPSCLDTMWRIAERFNGVDVIQGNLFSEDKGDVLFKKGRYPAFSDNKKWIRANIATLKIPESACIKLVKRDLILKNNLFFKEGWIQEDTLWSYNLHDFIDSIAFCDAPLYYYRKNPNSIMHSSGNKKEADAFVKIFNEVYLDLLNKEIHSYDLRFLEIVSMRIEKANGKDGYLALLPYNNHFFKIMFDNNGVYLRNLSNLPIKVICKIRSAFIRNMLCLKEIYKIR